jgi:TolB-like protein/Tfp pilus assembly protein PilF
MSDKNGARLKAIWRELRDRKVVRVALVYVLMAWGLMQVGELLFEALQVPEGALTLLVILVLLGFPVAVVLAWAYEITPEGVRRDVVAELQPILNQSPGPRQDVAQTNRIAILPFSDMAPKHDLKYFCEGLAEEVQNALCEQENLEVVARAHAIRFGGSKLDIKKVATKLEVRAVLEGSVRIMKGEVRISIQLVCAASGTDVWSRSFDFLREDEIGIQKQVAHEIALLTRQTFLRPDIVDRQCNHAGYEFMRQGLLYFRRRTARDTLYARQMFKRAIHAEPSYGAAWSCLVYTYAFEFLNFNHHSSIRRRAIRLLNRACSLAPDFAETYVAKGLALSMDHRTDDASDAFEAATALDPGNFEAWYFNACNWARAGKQSVAIDLFKKASSCDSSDYQSILLRAQLYDSLGNAEAGQRMREKGLRLAHSSLVRRPDDHRALSLGALAHLQLGHRAKALQWMQQALEQSPRDALLEYNAACFYALDGDFSQSVQHLDKARLAGVLDEEWIRNDSNLDALRQSGLYPRREAVLPEALILPIVSDSHITQAGT